MKYLALFLPIMLLIANPARATGLLCPAGEYSVRSHFRNGYTRSDGTMVKAATVKQYCKLLSKGYEFAKSRFKNGVPPNWPHKQEIAGAWTEEEKERIIEALDELPDFLLTDKIIGFYRLKKSKDYPNPASNSDGVIILYDSAFGPSQNLSRVLAHELAHQNYEDLNERSRQDYRRATGWHMELEPNGKIFWVGRKDDYVEDDGKNSYEEDYANNLEHFLYNPDKLKKVTPSAYDWFKKRFGDKLKFKAGKK